MSSPFLKPPSPSPPPRRSRPRQYVKKLLAAVLSFFIALVLCEIGLRIVDYAYTPLTIELRGGMQDWRRSEVFTSDAFVSDPKLFWRPRPNHGPFNAQGFRGRCVWMDKAPGEFRILALGDSNTLGWNAGSNWPEPLEKLVRQLHPQARVINAGVYGYTSYQGVERFREMLVFRPDLVLVSFGGNDGHRVLLSDAEFSLGSFPPLVYNLRLGHLLIAARDRWMARRIDPERCEPVPRVSLKEFREHTLEIIRIAQQHKIQCVLLTRPYVGASKDPLSWKSHAPDYVEVTYKISRVTGVPVIDVYARFRDKNKYFLDESHFGPEGHALAAEFIFENIKPLLPRHLEHKDVPE